MRKYLENVRSKPAHVRQFYALGVSFCITAIIFVFWMGTFGVSTSSGGTYAEHKESSPFNVIGAAVSDGFGSIKDLFDGRGERSYEAPENNIIVTSPRR
ncbi:MAG: hypothetical protein V4526_00655 [Patescibacteria group bacterium]